MISIDADKSDVSTWHVRPDNDYGSVWIKNYGEGRVFNCAMGHTPTLFETPELAQMMLNAIQFVLGDLPADTLTGTQILKAVPLPKIFIYKMFCVPTRVRTEPALTCTTFVKNLFGCNAISTI